MSPQEALQTAGRLVVVELAEGEDPYSLEPGQIPASKKTGVKKAGQASSGATSKTSQRAWARSCRPPTPSPPCNSHSPPRNPSEQEKPSASKPTDPPAFVPHSHILENVGISCPEKTASRALSPLQDRASER